MIKFDEKSHTYTDEHNRKYLSVTTWIGKLFPFHRNAIIARIIKSPNSPYYGWTVKQVSADWAKSSKEGNRVHKACEDYINDNIITEDKEVRPCVEQFIKLKFTGRLKSELRVYDEDLLIAGTADIVEFCVDAIYLYDIKTYKKIDDDRIKKMSIQLEIYRRLLEKMFNKPCKVMGGIIFEGFVKNKENTKLRFIPAIDKTEFVNQMFENRRIEIEALECERVINSKEI